MASHLEYVNLQNRGFDYPIRSCLEVLRAAPQSWTSYSNHRKDADVLCEVRREPLERAQSLQTFKSMLRDLGVLVNAFSEIDLDLQEFKRKAADIYSNLHDVLGAAVNTRDNFDMFAGSVSALDKQMSSLEASAEKMKASMLEDLDLAQLNKEHNARNLELSKTLAQQIIQDGMELRRQEELSRAAMERSTRLKQAYLETLTRNVSQTLVHDMDFVQEGLNGLKLHLQKLDKFNSQQALHTMAQYAHWVLPWLQSGWMSGVWSYVGPLIRSRTPFMITAASLLLVLISSFGPGISQNAAECLYKLMPLLDSTSMAIMGAAGGSFLALWAYRRSRQSRAIARPQTQHPRLNHSAVDPQLRSMTRSHAKSIGGERKQRTNNGLGGRKSLLPTLSKDADVRGRRAVSLEPELCSYFRTGEL